MIKKIIPIFLILICINVAYAAELTILNEEYNPGETLQATISDLESLTSSQISLLDSESNSLSVSPLISEYKDDNYFIYFNLPTDLTEGTHRVLAGSLEANFTISNRSTAVQIKPAFFVFDSSKDSFVIKLENLGLSETVVISASDVTINPRKSSYTLGSGEVYNLYTYYDYSKLTEDQTLTISYDETTYNIPLFFPDTVEESTDNETTTEEVVVENETIIEENITEEVIVEDALVFLTESESADINLDIGESFEGYLKLQNNLNRTLTDLTFTLTGDLEEVVRINISEVTNLSSEEIISQYLWVNEEENGTVGTFEGELILSNEEYSTSLPIIITLTEEEEEVEETIPETETSGSSTNYDEIGQSEAESNSSIMVIGIVLILLLGGIFTVLFLKLKKGNEKKFQQYINETKKK